MSPYAVSKLAAEGYCRTFALEGGPETVCLRYFNVYGPRQDPDSPYAAVVPRFVSALAAGEPVVIHGDGLQSRDFTYVADVVEANLLAASAPDANGAAINVSGGRPVTLLALAEAIGGVLGRPVRRRHGPPRPGDVRDSWADLSKARRTLGYEPRTPLDAGLASTVEAALSAGRAPVAG
jgi:UDP-glucose 4-epimerase